MIALGDKYVARLRPEGVEEYLKLLNGMWAKGYHLHAVMPQFVDVKKDAVTPLYLIFEGETDD